jgi:hypothetical protein
MPSKKTAIKAKTPKKAKGKKEPAKKTIVKTKETKTKARTVAVSKKTKPIAKKAPPKPVKAKTAKAVPPTSATSKTPQPKIDSSLMVQGAKFIKTSFFHDIEKEDHSGKRKHLAHSKSQEKPTAWSRPKIGSSIDSKNLVEILSQQLEYENRTYFEGCEGQICTKCNIGYVDQKFYVNKSLGYCTECAELLELGQSKEGVFSDAQMELMQRSMERSMQKAKDIDENDLESALALDDMDDMDELEEALLAVEEDSEFNA